MPLLKLPRFVPTFIFAVASTFISSPAHARKCVPELSTKELCVLPSANMSRISRSPEVLLAAKVVAKKMKPYLPANDPWVYLIMGYRSAEEQERIRRTGVRAGPSSGKFQSAHIYGVAVDVEIQGNRKLGKELCAALNQIIPLLKNKGGVIMEGSGGGSTNGHIDDNWGARFSVEQTGVQKTLNYTGGECPETYGVSGPSAELFKEMAKINANSLEEDHSDLEPAIVDEEPTDDTAKAEKPAKGRKPSSWKFH